MFQSYKFKQMLGLSFGANFEAITTDREHKKSCIGTIGVQVLTIDEISLLIISDENLRNNIISGYTRIVKDLIQDDFPERHQTSLVHVLYDLKYMTRSKTLQYIVKETTIIEQLLEQLIDFYYKDRQENRVEHITYDFSVVKEGLYNMDIQVTRTFKSFLKAIDPSDIPRNKRLMGAFIGFFDTVNK